MRFVHLTSLYYNYYKKQCSSYYTIQALHTLMLDK